MNSRIEERRPQADDPDQRHGAGAAREGEAPRLAAAASPVVFITSQVAPSSAYPTTSATPVMRLNGVSQSNQPPA